MVNTHELISILTIFCRVSGIFFLVPPFSNTSFKPIFRGALAIAIAFMFSQNSQSSHYIQSNSNTVFLIIVSEIILGVALAVIINTLCSVVQVAGFTIASQMGLSAAAIFDPSQQTQNSTVGTILSILMIIVMMESGLSTKIISGIGNSYDTIPIGYAFDQYNNIINLLIKTICKMWEVSIQMSMPFILINIIMMVAIGILAKLMPQMQVFFIFLPLQIIIGIFLFAIMLSSLLVWFLSFLGDEISLIF